MNKRLIAILVAVVAVIGTAFVQIESKGNEARVHQHLTDKIIEKNIDTMACVKATKLSTKKYDPKVVDVSKLKTHLPLVSIQTNEKIPGGRPYDKKTDIPAYSMEKNTETTIMANMDIFDSDKSYNDLEDKPEVSSSIRIRVRGNSSRWFDKKSYFVRTIDQKEQENNIKIMGMEKNHDWALHGPFLDKSLMRNYLGMNISGMVMDYAPDVRYCEVVINGEYQGLYMMMETINRGKGRVDISGINEEKNISGYIIQFNTDLRRGATALENFTSYAKVLKKNSYVNLEYPGTYSATPELKKNIEHDVSRFEKALYSFDHDTPNYGFENYADFGEFVDYFILTEVFEMQDTGKLSTFYYKDVTGKIKPCVWDFNNACENYSEMETDDYYIRKFSAVQAPWFWMMIKDDDFVGAVISRYKELRKGILSDEYLEGYIDDTIDYLGPAITRNNAIWGYSFDAKNLNDENKLFPDSRNPKSYDEAVSQLKTALLYRTDWLDKNIDILKQYCHESAVKKFNH